MRIAYGVHGYGRGHATRALAVLTDLAERHSIQVFAGGDARGPLRGSFPVESTPTLAFAHHSDGRRSSLRTLRKNLPLLRDLLLEGPLTTAVTAAIRDFAPDVVISDAEPWTHWAAWRLGIPRIGFDHFGVLVHCRIPLPWPDRLKSVLDKGLYQLLMGAPERTLVSSFFEAPTRTRAVEVIPPLLRDSVLEVSASAGEHLLVYLNQGQAQLGSALLNALAATGREVRFYGSARRGREGNIVFRPAADRAFLEDLASSLAVVSTAGNQLVGEAIYYGKPLLVMPESCVEQRLNAAFVERLQIGSQVPMRALTGETLNAFLLHAPRFTANARLLAADGRRAAVTHIERWLRELPARAPAKPVPASSRPRLQGA
jgi:uncharacterized protein (TIGR00661 family)